MIGRQSGSQGRFYEPGRRKRGWLGFLVREGSSILVAVALLLVLWGGYAPTIDTIDKALWSTFTVALCCLGYVLLQAIGAVTLPLRRETGPLADLLASLLPVLVIGYTVIEWIRQGITPTDFELVVILLASAAALTDVIVFTWFSLRLNRLAPEIVPIE